MANGQVRRIASIEKAWNGRAKGPAWGRHAAAGGFSIAVRMVVSMA